LNTLAVIVGPTASGKTALSIQLALHFESEIISADSRQFYKAMSIGTAKPSQEDLDKVPHHFINTLDLDEKYNIGKYEEDAIKKINELFQTHELIFVSGGSGLYINAICNGIDELPESVPEIREELNRIYKTKGIESLKRKLRESDPEYYSSSDINNPQRIMRALEIFMIAGKKFSEMRIGNPKKRDFNIKKIGILVDRDELYDRINKRVDEMISKGLVEEVQSLLPYRNKNSLQTVGYKEIFDYIDDKISLQEAIALIKQNTRNYAKRQMTWFRKDPEVKWFEVHEIEKMKRFIEQD
jgi:tRNA dimethylallyltransferase